MANPRVLSSPYSPIYPTNPDTGNLLVDLNVGTSTPTQRSINIYTSTSSFTISAGAKSISIANSGNTTGTINSTNIKAGTTISINTDNNDTLGSISGNATGTEFTIIEIR